jgi:membrane associated rhomboid family serine protease
MKIMATTIAKGTFALKRIFLTYIMVLLISVLVYAVFSIYPSVNSMLEDSISTPWGIVTSIFAHSSLDHITLNMAALFVFVLLFAFCNCTFPSQDKRKTESFFLVSSFGSAIVANVLWLFVTSNPSVGASGLVYATEGNLLGFSLFNGVQLLYFSKLKAQKPATVFVVIMNLLVFVLFSIQILLNSAAFLSVGQGVNIIAQGVSFLLCFLVSILWYRLFGKVSILE